MSVTYIPEKIKLRLWGKAAGRCQYRGCNNALYVDGLTKAEFNSAYIAHIVADSPNGPRGDEVQSEKLKSDESNLMLMCDVHHRLIDKGDVAGHPVELLTSMKSEHEERIELQSSVLRENQSHLLFYGAKIGQHDSPLTFSKTSVALKPDWYPACYHPIELGFKNSSFQDAEGDYWSIELENLNRKFDRHVRRGLESGDIGHISIFGLAPIPLLIALGRELSDIPGAEVYQLHREPATWEWQPTPPDISYSVVAPDVSHRSVALVLSLSANIERPRITSVLGEDVAIWEITHVNPNNDFLKGRDQLSLFRETLRTTFNRIKKQHGEDTQLHVFPAIPVACAIEIGRVWMPKADLPFVVYDQNKKLGGFTATIEIK